MAGRIGGKLRVLDGQAANQKHDDPQKKMRAVAKMEKKFMKYDNMKQKRE